MLTHSVKSDLRRSRVVGSVLVTIVIGLCMPTSAAAQVRPEALMTRVTDAVIRSEAAPGARVVASLPIGSELTVLGVEPNWIFVHAAAANGWIAASLTVPFDGSRRTEIVEAIVLPRIGATPDARQADVRRFEDRTQVVALLEKTAALETDRERLAGLALLRLRAIDHVLRAIRHQGTAAQRRWLDHHDGQVAYNEISGRWMLDPRHLTAIREQYAGTAAADDIAWLRVENGVQGECEGDVPCYVSWKSQTAGEYLRLHPNGRHVREALTDVARLGDIMNHLEQFPRVLAEFTPARCPELVAVLMPLESAVTQSSGGDQAPARTALDRYERLCTDAATPQSVRKP